MCRSREECDIIRSLNIVHIQQRSFVPLSNADIFEASSLERWIMMRPVAPLPAFAGVLLATLLVQSPGSAQTYVVRKVEATQKGYDDIHISKAAIPGQQVRLWSATLLNPDCTEAGTITTQVLEQPHHGQVSISDEPFFPNYIAPNPRASCDAHKAPGKQAFYIAEAGFHGHDKVILKNATSEGRIRRVIVDIDVQ
jgi:hypothetical protein